MFLKDFLIVVRLAELAAIVSKCHTAVLGAIAGLEVVTDRFVGCRSIIVRQRHVELAPLFQLVLGHVEVMAIGGVVGFSVSVALLTSKLRRGKPSDRLPTMPPKN